MQIHSDMALVTKPLSAGTTFFVGMTRPAIIEPYLPSGSFPHGFVSNLFQEVHVGKARITPVFGLNNAFLPIFCLGSAAPGGTVYNIDYNVPIGCAGCLVCPGDIMVGDEDGVVVIPHSLVDHAAAEIQVIEDREVFIRLMLAEGHSQHGLYPMGPAWEERFQAWRAQRGS